MNWLFLQTKTHWKMNETYESPSVFVIVFWSSNSPRPIQGIRHTRENFPTTIKQIYISWLSKSKHYQKQTQLLKRREVHEMTNLKKELFHVAVFLSLKSKTCTFNHLKSICFFKLYKGSLLQKKRQSFAVHWQRFQSNVMQCQCHLITFIIR